MGVRRITRADEQMSRRASERALTATHGVLHCTPLYPLRLSASSCLFSAWLSSLAGSPSAHSSTRLGAPSVSALSVSASPRPYPTPHLLLFLVPFLLLLLVLCSLCSSPSSSSSSSSGQRAQLVAVFCIAPAPAPRLAAQHANHPPVRTCVCVCVWRNRPGGWVRGGRGRAPADLPRKPRYRHLLRGLPQRGHALQEFPHPQVKGYEKKNQF